MDKQVLTILDKKTSKPKFIIAKGLFLILVICCLITVPLVYLYTPFGEGVLLEHRYFVIVGLEVLFFYIFLRAYLDLKEKQELQSLKRKFSGFFQLSNKLFFIVVLTVSLVSIYISTYSKKVALVVMVLSLIGYWLYRDMYGRTNNESKKIK